METKEICQKLNQFLDELNLGGKHRVNLSLFGDAADRLKELEKENEAMMKELCKKEYLVREAEGRVQELEIQLDRQKAENPKWISVEDEPIPGEQSHIFTVLPKIIIKRNPVTGEPAYWMRLESPKPKEPTFKDVFLKAFPKADIEDGDDGNSLICRNVVFFGRALCSQFPICSECWNQPYFEEEGGEE